MKLEHENVQYEIIRLSDVVRDGMALELYEITNNDSFQILEAFWSDIDNRFTFSAFKENLPFEIVEKFIFEARKLLPPTKQ